MQYGNDEGSITLLLFLAGLNRTMQYGNLHVMTGQRCESAGFKSYYVVWKQEGTSIRLKLGKQFKSYYVVWKRGER